MRYPYYSILALFLTFSVDALGIIPSLFNSKNPDGVSTKPIKRDYSVRAITQCPGQGAGSIPTNATKFGGSARVPTSPQAWSLDCYVQSKNDRSPTNWFSYSGGHCNDDEVAFDDVPSPLKPPRVVCVTDPPQEALRPLPPQRKLPVVRELSISPKWYLASNSFEYVQVVTTKSLDRSAFYTADIMVIQIRNRDGGIVGTTSCKDCSSLLIRFPSTPYVTADILLRVPVETDVPDMYAYFAGPR